MKESFWDKPPKKGLYEKSSDYRKRYRLWDYYRKMKKKGKF